MGSVPTEKGSKTLLNESRELNNDNSSVLAVKNNGEETSETNLLDSQTEQFPIMNENINERLNKNETEQNYDSSTLHTDNKENRVRDSSENCNPESNIRHDDVNELQGTSERFLEREDGKNGDEIESESEDSLSSLIQRISNFLMSKKSETSKMNDSNGTEEPEVSTQGMSKRKKPRKRSKRPVIISYPQSQKPRQPFMVQPTSNRPPNPPSYYTNAVTEDQHQPRLLRGANENQRERRVEFRNQNLPSREEQVLRPNVNYAPGQVMMMPNTAMNFSYWAPYPENIPANIPACLAHLYAADSLFVIQQMDIVELFIDVAEPNYYLIQDTSGQCLYYAYETTDMCMGGPCDISRGFQLHVMDMYHNEIIYMNKPCGCNNCFCCFPVMEVYSPPLVPVGAITQNFSLCGTEFSILDADENKTFKIHGPSCCITSCRCGEADFTIHALDREETEVGVIRRQMGNFISSLFTNTDYYGISFPVDLDVRIKAVFLGALFLIEYSYYDDKPSS